MAKKIVDDLKIFNSLVADLLKEEKEKGISTRIEADKLFDPGPSKSYAFSTTYYFNTFTRKYFLATENSLSILIGAFGRSTG